MEKMAEKIFNGNDVARLRGLGSYRNMITTLAKQRSQLYTGQVTNQDPVHARIDFGRWLADCQCGGAEYVDPDDAVFFCQSCGNAAYGGRLRKVIFPGGDTRGEIEGAVLERPVVSVEGGDPVNQALLSKGADGISRSWNPGETVKQLRAQHKLAKALKKEREVKRGV